MARLGVTRAE